MNSLSHLPKKSFSLLLTLLLTLLLPFAVISPAHAIVNGRAAVALNGQVQVWVRGTYVCTGNLLSTSWVLTAAHCLNNANAFAGNTTIFLGDLQLGLGENHAVDVFDFNPANADAVLIHLATPTAQTWQIARYGVGVPPTGATVVIRGWGNTSTVVRPSPAATLQIAALKVTNSQYTDRTYGPAGSLLSTEAAGDAFPNVGDSGAGISYRSLVCAVLNRGTDDGTFQEAIKTDYLSPWIFQTTGIASSGRCDQDTNTTNPSTCDIYAAGGTPCVAAHSTVRALFSGYTGLLYQIQRASDNQRDDIMALSTGYADTNTQDFFCSKTTCTITKIYDQMNLNDLVIEGPGGTVPTPDAGALASSLPITLNGNKVYGLNVTAGVGYRNNATTGVAKGGSAEGMYMVTSGTNVDGAGSVNGGCCFDYGNVEANSDDNGNGHMDAINFGTNCFFPPCSGSGPWVAADLENGLFQGNGSNLGDQSISSNFVTAMLKNNGVSTFALHAGNAQSGGLTTEYAGTLPTSGGYTPMSQEGGIVLGTGGDNSNWSVGSFFEGAMTSGYPSDATESAVQANIVAAGYGGSSGSSNNSGSGGGGGNSGGGGTSPSGPYAGPNDPGGPGPQDGFAPTAIEQPNDIMGSKPALASFNGSLYAAFQANDASHRLEITSSIDGVSWPTAQGVANPGGVTPQIEIGGAPAMTVFHHELFLAFQANDPSHQLFVTSSPTGTNFPAATPYGNLILGSAPAMTVFNHELFLAFQANDASHRLEITSSIDGVNWPTAHAIANIGGITPQIEIGSQPAMAVFKHMLYVAYRANDPSNNAFIASSPDGVNFTYQPLPGQTMGGNSAPALVVSNNTLYYIYGANDTDNEMLVAATTDGVNWQGPAAYLNTRMGAAGPAAAAFGNGVSVAFQSNDSRNVLFVTNKATEASGYTGPNDPGGSGPQDNFASPALEQQNIVMGTKPGLTSFNNSVYVAFQANDPSDQLFVASSPSGLTFPNATPYSNLVPGSAPALAVLNGKLFIAFQANDASNQLFVTSSSTGTNFPNATPYGNIILGSAPAMTVFQNKLWIAFQANDASNHLFLTSSSDGVNWPDAHDIANPGGVTPQIEIGSAPALQVFNSKLYVAYRANDPSNTLFIASSSDGVNFSYQPLTGQKMGPNSSPALAISNGALYCVYSADDTGNEMVVTATTDGSTWQGPAAYLNMQMSDAGPAVTPDSNGSSSKPVNEVFVGFQANNPGSFFFGTFKVTSVK